MKLRHWEAATALIAWAEGKRDDGVRVLRMAVDHEDAVDKHPVTPGALLPVSEMLADLRVENGRPDKSLKEYEAALKTAPRRFNATADADKAADKTKARAYALQLQVDFTVGISPASQTVVAGAALPIR